MLTDLVITPYTGDLLFVLDFMQWSTKLQAESVVRQWWQMQHGRGVHYYVAKRFDHIVGLVGVYADTVGFLNEMEPPQLTELAVHPGQRGQGIGKALIEFAAAQAHRAGHNRLWAQIDGNNADLLRFFLKQDFYLVAAVPHWFGDGSVKAVLRLDFAAA